MNDDKPRQPPETPGAPRKFSYPEPPSFTEEEKRRYADAAKRVNKIIAKMKRRRRKRR